MADVRVVSALDVAADRGDLIRGEGELIPELLDRLLSDLSNALIRVANREQRCVTRD